MKSFTDEQLILFCDLALRIGRRSDRWDELEASGQAQKMGVSKEDFESVDEYVGSFVRFWAYFLNDMKEDLSLRSYLYSRGGMPDKEEYKRWHLSQIESGVRPNGPTYLSLLRKQIAKNESYASLPTGGSARGEVDARSRKHFVNIGEKNWAQVARDLAIETGERDNRLRLRLGLSLSTLLLIFLGYRGFLVYEYQQQIDLIDARGPDQFASIADLHLKQYETIPWWGFEERAIASFARWSELDGGGFTRPIEKKLFLQAKAIPATEYQKNLDIYEELKSINPQNTLYIEKISLYSKKVEEEAASIAREKERVANMTPLEMCIDTMGGQISSSCREDPVFTYCGLNYERHEIIGSGCTSRVKQQGTYSAQVKFCESQSLRSVKRNCAIEIYGCSAVTGDQNC